MIEIRHKETEHTGVFEAWLDGKQAGEMTYLRQTASPMSAHKSIDTTTKAADTAQDIMVINHTQVFDGYEGQGIARQMVMAAVEFARRNTRKIIPSAPMPKPFSPARTNIKIYSHEQRYNRT